MAAAAATIVFAATAATAQTAEELFDATTLHDLHLRVNERDLEDLRRNYLANTYYQADVEWRGVTVRNAAIRSRGNWSRSDVKPGLRIDFNKYVSKQRFLGHKSLVLDNLLQDPSFVRESLTMAMFARLGLAAPRESFVRLFINGAYQGLYTVVEPIDADFLTRTTGEEHGYAFDYEWVEEFYGQYLGQSFAPYKERFKPETRENDGDVVHYTAIHNLFAAINMPHDGTWRERVEQYLDVPQFLTHVAIEQFVSEVDGVMGKWAMNNFYLSRPAASPRHQVLPWDRDTSFYVLDSSILVRTEQNLIFQGLMAYPDLRAFFYDQVEASARAAAEGDWLEQQITQRAELIRAAVTADTSKPYGDDSFEAGIAFLIAFARLRPGIVLDELARLRDSMPMTESLSVGGAPPLDVPASAPPLEAAPIDPPPTEDPTAGWGEPNPGWGWGWGDIWP